MKLLFDQNLSPQLCISLQDLFPQSIHVRDAGLAFASDSVIWEFAAGHDYTIITKDADFRQRSFVAGFPPRIIWVRTGNCSTTTIETLLRQRIKEIRQFSSDDEKSFLVLG